MDKCLFSGGGDEHSDSGWLFPELEILKEREPAAAATNGEPEKSEDQKMKEYTEFVDQNKGNLCDF